jgi:hypothetical protein
MEVPSLKEAVILVLGNSGSCLNLTEIKKYLEESYKEVTDKEFTDSGLRSTISKLKQEGSIEKKTGCYKLSTKGLKVYEELSQKYGISKLQPNARKRPAMVFHVLDEVKVVKIDTSLLEELGEARVKSLVEAYMRKFPEAESAKEFVVFSTADGALCIGEGSVGKLCLELEEVKEYPQRYAITLH